MTALSSAAVFLSDENEKKLNNQSLSPLPTSFTAGRHWRHSVCGISVHRCVPVFNHLLRCQLQQIKDVNLCDVHKNMSDIYL